MHRQINVFKKKIGSAPLVRPPHCHELSGIEEEENEKLSKFFKKKSERKIQNDHHELLMRAGRVGAGRSAEERTYRAYLPCLCYSVFTTPSLLLRAYLQSVLTNIHLRLYVCDFCEHPNSVRQKQCSGQKFSKRQCPSIFTTHTLCRAYL